MLRFRSAPKCRPFYRGLDIARLDIALEVSAHSGGRPHGKPWGLLFGPQLGLFIPDFGIRLLTLAVGSSRGHGLAIRCNPVARDYKDFVFRLLDHLEAAGSGLAKRQREAIRHGRASGGCILTVPFGLTGCFYCREGQRDAVRAIGLDRE